MSGDRSMNRGVASSVSFHSLEAMRVKREVEYMLSSVWETSQRLPPTLKATVAVETMVMFKSERKAGAGAGR